MAGYFGRELFSCGQSCVEVLHDVFTGLFNLFIYPTVCFLSDNMPNLFIYCPKAKTKRILHCLSATIICCFPLSIYSFFCFGRPISTPPAQPIIHLSCLVSKIPSPLLGIFNAFCHSGQKQRTRG